VSDAVVSAAIKAARASRWEELKLLLHPYLHWRRLDGVTLHGRRHVLAWLTVDQPPLQPPTRYELRDGQIYRWWS